MKRISLLLLLVGMTSTAQIKGNGNLETRSFSTANLTDIEIGLYAEIVIDQSQKEGMIITTDTNLFELIDTEVVDGTLKLEQKEWIQASQPIRIYIGAPNIKRVQQGTNDLVRVVNLDIETMSIMALNGTIELSGKANSLGIGAENGMVKAGSVTAKEVYLSIWGRGEAIIAVTDFLEVKLSDMAKLTLVTTPKKIKGDLKTAVADDRQTKSLGPRYITFRIKNNSTNRNHFYVLGPKPDGGDFSYGFPMMPGKVRKEKWTTGTKIYKVNRLGLRKLLVTITDSDAGRTVPLF